MRTAPPVAARCAALAASRVAVVMLALGLPLAARAQAQTEAAAPLTVCLDVEHPPFSVAAPVAQGFDLALAQALAQRLGRTAQWTWVQVPQRGGLLRALREQLGGGHCDVFTAVPPQALPAGSRWRHSAPYAVLRYRWAAAPGAPVPDDPPRRARAIGVVTATPADLYLHRQGLPRSPYPDNAALLTALARGEVPVALVWSAALAGVTPPPRLGPRGPDDPSLQTALTLATRASDTALADALDRALTALVADGTLARLAAAHGLPADPMP